MSPEKINLTHNIDGVRVVRRPIPCVKQGRKAYSIGMEGGAERVFYADRDVSGVSGYTERMGAGEVRSSLRPGKLDYAERKASFGAVRRGR